MTDGDQLDRIEARLGRLERALGQYVERTDGLFPERLERELSELVQEWQRVKAERIPPRPAPTAPHPGRYAPVFNATMDLELRKAAGDA